MPTQGLEEILDISYLLTLCEGAGQRQKQGYGESDRVNSPSIHRYQTQSLICIPKKARFLSIYSIFLC